MRRMTTLVACWTILLVPLLAFAYSDSRLELLAAVRAKPNPDRGIDGLADYLSRLSQPSVPAEAALAAAR
jgi:hypothetical protein